MPFADLGVLNLQREVATVRFEHMEVLIDDEKDTPC